MDGEGEGEGEDWEGRKGYQCPADHRGLSWIVVWC